MRTPSRSTQQSRSGIPTFQNNTGSHIPTPAAAQSEVGSSVTDSRKRQNKRDEAIRRKIENDLNKKKQTVSGPRSRTTRKIAPGSVMALKPSAALQIKPNTTVAEAAQLMAAKREDCVLVTDDDDRISGIFTAKDLAFRVVGQGIDSRDITIAQIMTKNPLCARTDTSATDALELMVSKGFRHLPVMDENQDISGILDITKCFYEAMEKLERAYSSSRKLYDALEGVQSELGSSQPQQIIQYVEALRQKMSGPTLESVLTGIPPTTVSVRTTVREAAQLMRENRTTAVLVQDQGNITGIFTSKDVVLRVIAPGLDPGTCSVVRVMTPHPDFAPMDMSIQAALRKMHDGHYLNLPVMNPDGEIVGMADVLKLTYATLEQISSIQTADSEGPAWNRFWLSLENDTESVMSDGTHRQPSMINRPASIEPPVINRHASNYDSVLPHDSASHVGGDSPIGSHLGQQRHTYEEQPFPFKFKAPSGRVHRVQVLASGGIAGILHSITEKLGAEVEDVGGAPVFDEEGRIESHGFAISYVDDEGDVVSITSDQDLVDSINIARNVGADKVDLYVHDPKKPAVPVVVEAPPAPVQQKPTRRRTHRSETEESEEEETDRKSRRKSKVPAPPPVPEQLIQGVPNELILPGALVTLAVTIVVVFALSRSSR
ncbi:CBS and PB1 domain protein [Ascobolus immersus RN42]|uniref:CBS and PB1 domain protein n=1 Tax=Ascobolus immersus RN42 TaxID=1160509 RepID=A0A3N4I9V0_ASCIM|nr:CBS and PB1 domain protein [Ascobolus immersus RN42]